MPNNNGIDLLQIRSIPASVLEATHQSITPRVASNGEASTFQVPQVVIPLSSS